MCEGGRINEVQKSLIGGAKISIHFSLAKGLDKTLEMNRFLI
jgi:hypothetical protein